jgi:hypothetical protein
MESLDDIEEFYQRELEDLDREFFLSLKKNKDKNQVIKTYRDKLNLLRINYEKKFKRFLDSQKTQIQKNKEKILSDKNKSTKKQPIFEVKKINFLEIGKKEDSRLKKEMFDFRFNLKLRKFHNRIPNFMLVFYFKARFFLRKTNSSIKDFMINVYEFFKRKIFELISGVKELFVKISDSIKKLMAGISKIIAKLKSRKKKKKEDKVEKTEEKKEEKSGGGEA